MVLLCAVREPINRRERDPDPVWSVAGLVDHFIHGLVELEGGEQGGVVARIDTRLHGIPLEEGALRVGDPGPRRPWVVVLPRSAGVIETAEHPRHIAHPLVGLGAFGERTKRLSLKVEQDPAALVGVKDLAQVVVAVDPLHGWPSDLRCCVVDARDEVGEALQFGHLSDGLSIAIGHARHDLRARVLRRRRGAQCGGEDGVHLGGGPAQSVRGFAEVGALLDGAAGHPPGVLDAGQELLREGEMDR